MSPVVVLAAAGLVSWLLRVLFIALVPATRLPGPVLRALGHAGPATLAALVASGLARPASPIALLPALAALLVGGLVTWRTRRALAGTAAAIAAFALLTL
ncbi:MAG TPA: AzlD domain-containing protein [Pseudonocardia sp.]|nr:AzlD domain-containing protein [Pseudonocardia sp.]